MRSVALRVQQLDVASQVLTLCRLAETRADDGRFSPAAVADLFEIIGLPSPAKVSNVLATLEQAQLIGRQRRRRGSWRLTPLGRARSVEVISDMDLVALGSEASRRVTPSVGQARHPVIDPMFAPPDLLAPLAQFLADHPFELNILGMTRFPDEQDDAESDPLAGAITVTREVCGLHGMEFHLASDRAMVDDLWANVAAHMWAARYGIGFFEDRRNRGVNYNLTTEMGGMLIAGRRCALLKDASIERLPTDLTGKIYRPVDFDDSLGVSRAVHEWLSDDLRLGRCKSCP